jgi:hypothetical protein
VTAGNRSGYLRLREYQPRKKNLSEAEFILDYSMKKNLTSLSLLLVLFFLYGCSKQNVVEQKPNPWFIKATFNGTPWQLTAEKPTPFSALTFQASLNPTNKRWSIHILTDKNNSDTVCRGIWISFDYVPTVGKHYFNNVPLSYLPEGGMLGYYSYYNTVSNTWDNRYSKDGYVEITSISRDELKGNFSFNSIAQSSTDTAVVAITSGAFYLPFTAGSDYWTGP